MAALCVWEELLPGRMFRHPGRGWRVQLWIGPERPGQWYVSPTNGWCPPDPLYRYWDTAEDAMQAVERFVAFGC